MRVADLDIPAVFTFSGKRWVSSSSHTQADTMRWCLDLDGGHLLQLPMDAEVVLLDEAEAAHILATRRELVATVREP